MMKFKAMPDIGVLILRIIVGGVVLTQLIISLSQAFSTISLTWNVILTLVVLGLGSLLILLGLFARWAAAVIVLYYLVSAVIYLGHSGQIVFDLIGSVLPTVAPYVAIFFIGGGIYSLDEKLFGKKQAAV